MKPLDALRPRQPPQPVDRMDALAAVIKRWREEAALLRRYGHEATALACEKHAAELEAALGEAAAEELTLAEASAESGYSERRLRELIASGAVPNTGRKNRPRIRRGELPRRAGKRPSPGGYDPEADARQLLGRAG